MPMPQEGSRLKYKSTGIFFEVKKITNQFVILNSMDGSRQIMTGKQNLTTLFEPEEFPPAEATQEDTD